MLWCTHKSNRLTLSKPREMPECLLTYKPLLLECIFIPTKQAEIFSLWNKIINETWKYIGADSQVNIWNHSGLLTHLFNDFFTNTHRNTHGNITLTYIHICTWLYGHLLQGIDTRIYVFIQTYARPLQIHIHTDTPNSFLFPSLYWYVWIQTST